MALLTFSTLKDQLEEVAQQLQADNEQHRAELDLERARHLDDLKQVTDEHRRVAEELRAEHARAVSEARRLKTDELDQLAKVVQGTL